MMRRYIFTVIFLFCIACNTAFADRNDRGVASLNPDHPHLAKGENQVGGIASFSMHGNDNYAFFVTDGVTSNGYSFKVEPYYLYAFADDFAAGISVYYNRSMLDVAKAGIAVKDIAFSVEDLYSIGDKWGASIFARKYLVLGHTGRFAFYVDMGLDFNLSHSKLSNRQDGQIIGTYQQDLYAGLFVKPGISFYLTDCFSMQAGIGLVKLGINNTKQVHNQVAEGSRNGFTGYYMVDLLALNVGFTFSF